MDIHKVLRRKTIANNVTREYKAIARRFEPQVAQAFILAAQRAKDKVTIQAMAQAIREGDIQKAIELAGGAQLALSLRGVGVPPKETDVQNLLLDAFRAGGVMGATQLPKRVGLAATLDMTNPSSLAYVRDNIPQLIKQVTDEQRQAVQSIIARGFAEQIDPMSLAREIRDVVGLTEQGAQAVANFRRQLETGQMGNGTAPWDRRLSGPQQAQARSEFYSDTTNAARVNRLVDNYSFSLLNRRAQNISITQIHDASIQGQAEIWRQADNEGLIDLTRARRFWIDTKDERERPEHRVVPGMNPNGVAFDEPFQTPVGPVMRPGESGVAGFDINCRCVEGLDFEG